MAPREYEFGNIRDYVSAKRKEQEAENRKWLESVTQPEESVGRHRRFPFLSVAAMLSAYLLGCVWPVHIKPPIPLPPSPEFTSRLLAYKQIVPAGWRIESQYSKTRFYDSVDVFDDYTAEHALKILRHDTPQITETFCSGQIRALYISVQSPEDWFEIEGKINATLEYILKR